MRIEPYLFFDGRCEEAIEFYKKTLVAEVMMQMRNKEAPEQPPPGMLSPGSENKIMHATLRIGETNVHASDGRNAGKPNFQGFSLSISAANEAEAKQRFNALAEGGKITMPLGKTFFASSFGMLTDRFGVGWMIIVGK